MIQQQYNILHGHHIIYTVKFTYIIYHDARNINCFIFSDFYIGHGLYSCAYTNNIYNQYGHIHC